MKAADDKKTPDLLGDSCDLAGPVPSPVNKAALRAARFKERHGVQALTVNIPADLLAEFSVWTEARGKKKADVIAHLIRTQLLRKR